MNELEWNKQAWDIYEKVIGQLPQFHRSIAQRLVKESAQELAKGRNNQTVEEQDLIIAFFNEVPPAFKDMMKRLFKKLNIDYARYVKG